tara:strand:+ start:786 stop:1232 length:447 start_codon:yes stop_codon:yes gene_type:complete
MAEEKTTLDPASFRNGRDESIRRSALKANNHLRMIPDVRDNGDKLLPNIDAPLPTTPPSSPRANKSTSSSKLISELEERIDHMDAHDYDRIRALFPTTTVVEPPSVKGMDNFTAVSLFAIGAIVGTALTFCSTRYADVTQTSERELTK